MKNVLYLLAVLMCQQLSAQEIRYVKTGGTGDGSSWQNASGDIQAMINASSADDAVWVAAGIYKPNNPINDPLNNAINLTSRISTFTMKSGVKLYGGFPDSGSPSFTDRDFDAFETQLSGDIGVIDSNADNCFHVCFFPDTDGALLDGFTVIGGHANGHANQFEHLIFIPSLSLEITNYQGGGLYIHGGNNTISNCRIIENRSLFAGGGIFSDGGNHTFTNNEFLDNLGRVGGGAVLINTGDHTFSFNRFEGNDVVPGINYGFPMPSAGELSAGGAISTLNANVNFTFNHFENNTATVPSTSYNAEGGALSLKGGSYSILNNDFISNSATFVVSTLQVCAGGAISAVNADLDVQGCIFLSNLSHGAGGAMRITNGTFQNIMGNRFSANEGVGNGGAIVFNGGSGNVVNNVFDFNISSGWGGAIHALGNGINGPHFVVNNSFYKNSTSSSEGAGAVSIDSGELHVQNNVFYLNTKTGSTTATWADIRFYNPGNSTFEYNLFQTGSTNPETGNIGYNGNNNPLFADPENGDFSILADSPCIGAGSNTHYLETFPEIDFLGNPRIHDGTIDMGAVEYPGTSSTATLSHKRSSIRVYPNPASAAQTVTLDTDERGIYFIFDATGKLVETVTCQAGANTLPLNYPQGIYYIQSSRGEGVKLILH